MDDQYSESSMVNGIIGEVSELDDGRKLFIKRVFAGDLLDIEDLREQRDFRVQDEITGERKIPDLSWLEDMLRQGRIRRIDDGPVRA